MHVALLSYAVTATAAFCTAAGGFLRQKELCRRHVAELAAALKQQQVAEHRVLEHSALDAKKEEFLSIVSHDLRTPLTSIHGALGLLSSGAVGSVDAEAQKLLRIASTNTDRLVRLINDLLDLQRMASGQLPMELASCSLAEVVAHAIETMRSMAEGAGVDIENACSGADVAFAGDNDRMQQVLCNLLSNAIKFSPRGAVVRVCSELRAHEVLLCIEDRGQGVPEAKLEAMFERFAQVDPSASRRKGGTGLGLAICRAIVAQHGGSLWARRNDAEGAAVAGITLYLLIPHLEEFAEACPAPARTAAVAAGEAPAGARRIVPGPLGRGDYAVHP